MGATQWEYFVPYQADMTRVLDGLRQEVYVRGDFQKPVLDLDFLDAMGFFEADEQEREEMITDYTLEPLRKPIKRFGIRGLRGWLEALDAAPAVQSRDELEALMCLSSSGTASILDIGHISAEKGDGGLFPLSIDSLQQHFGTTQPTRSMVVKWQRRAIRYDEEPLYKRGEGVYFTVYKDGKPDEIYIEGLSGD